MTELTHEAATELAGGYVLEGLDVDEMLAVERHLATCAETHPEFAELGSVVPYLALAVDPIEPSPAVRSRILAAIDGGTASAETPSLHDATGGGRGSDPSAHTRPSRPWWRSWGAVTAIGGAVAIGVLAVSAGWLAIQLASSRAYADEVAQAVAMAARPGSRVVALGSATGTGAALAVLPASGSGILVAHGLEPTSGREVYEAWLIQGSSAPAPAGSFSVGADGRGWLDSMAPAPAGPVTVALTREPAPGATKPTPPIIVSGASRPG